MGFRGGRGGTATGKPVPCEFVRERARKGFLFGEFESWLVFFVRGVMFTVLLLVAKGVELALPIFAVA